MLTIGSIFSGIGGLERGLERAGLGPTLWQIERSFYCRTVLAQHWPRTKRFVDVTTVKGTALDRVEIICGGFPCQDISSAGTLGERAGLRGARSGLWFEFLRIVSELRPSWVVVENIANRPDAWVDSVAKGLGQLGYATLPIPLAAADVGAPHLRERIFMLACNADEQAQSVGSVYAEVGELPSSAGSVSDWAERPRVRVADGYAPALRALGNAVVPKCAEVVGHVIRQFCET